MSVLFRFKFQPEAVFAEVEDTLFLALSATEAMHGQSQTEIVLRYWSEPKNRAVIIDGSTPVGSTLACVFHDLIKKSVSPTDFRFERVPYGEDARCV